MQIHGVESSVQRCFMLRSAAVEWKSRCIPCAHCVRVSAAGMSRARSVKVDVFMCFLIRWQNQFASCNAKKKKIRFLQVHRARTLLHSTCTSVAAASVVASQLPLTHSFQMLNAKEKRNQQAELTAVKSMMATHVSALAAAQARCDAAAAEVRCSA